jgi:hypothetical protein
MPILTTISLLPKILSMRRASRALALAGLLGTAGVAFGQLFEDRDWKESEVPPASAFNESRLVAIEMPNYMTLKFGVDPATIAITGDGVVRYVVVASNKSGGAVNAFYEGVRCATGEMKSYAYYGGDGWQNIAAPEWKPIWTLNSSYTAALARQGLCRGAAPRTSADEMIRRLKNPFEELP